MKRIIVWILLVAICLFGLTACSSDGKKTTNKDKEEKIENIIENATEDKNEEKIDIYEVELEENQGITEDGLIIDETLVLNGYKFTLRDKLEDFLNGTGAVIKNTSELEKFKNSKAFFADLECYIKDGNNTINFEISVGRDENEEITVREINIKSDAKYADGDFIEFPNLVTCGFSFLGGCDINDNFAKFPKEILERAENSEYLDSKNYELTLKTARGKYYKIILEATTSEEDPEYYYIDYVIVTSIAM